MKNLSENAALSPLHVGDVALRVRLEWRAVAGALKAVPRIANTQAVWVVAVSPDGGRVTWTDGLPARGGGEYRHTSDRRELLSLDALADELSPTDAPLPELAASEFNPAAAA